MNTREHFLAVMNFQADVPTLKWELGYWAATLRRWYGEGLPKRRGIPDHLSDGDAVRGPGWAWPLDRVRDEDAQACVGLSPGIERIPLNNLYYPWFQEETLETHDDWLVRRDEYGIVREERRDRTSIPRFVGWPVRSREDWEWLKAERLCSTLQGRLPPTWATLKVRFKGCNFPLAIGGGLCGFYGTLRYLLGEQNLLVGYHDDPQFIKDIITDLCSFWMALYDQVLEQVDVDLAVIWEDLCYNAGPLISPAHVQEFMLPACTKLTSFFRDHGVKIILVDTDGDCRSLIPIFLDGGVTGLYPFEVNAHMDVTAVRRAFPQPQILGGINKVAVAQGPASIDRELEARASPEMLRAGGYIPFVDHLVPPDVSWKDFGYYRRRLNECIDNAHRTQTAGRKVSALRG